MLHLSLRPDDVQPRSTKPRFRGDGSISRARSPRIEFPGLPCVCSASAVSRTRAAAERNPELTPIGWILRRCCQGRHLFMRLLVGIFCLDCFARFEIAKPLLFGTFTSQFGWKIYGSIRCEDIQLVRVDSRSGVRPTCLGILSRYFVL